MRKLLEAISEIYSYIHFALKKKTVRNPEENYLLWKNAAKSARDSMMRYADENGSITMEEWRIAFSLTSEDPHLNREAGIYDDLPF